MDKNQFNTNMIPSDYACCFNQQCPMHQRCVHYVAGTHVATDRLVGRCVYPHALRDGQCTLFREMEPVRMAWGFGRLYDYLPRHLRAAARSSVQAYFSQGASTYYRYHHGERKLTPRQQQEVVDIVMSLGSTQEPQFEHYEMAFDFT